MLKQSPEDNFSKQTDSYIHVSQSGTVIRITICVTKIYIIMNSNYSLRRMWIGRQRERVNELDPLTVQRGQWEDKSRNRNTFRIQFSREVVTGLLAEMHSHSACCWNHTKTGAPALFSAQLSLPVTASWYAIPNSTMSEKHFKPYAGISEHASVAHSRNAEIPVM